MSFPWERVQGMEEALGDLYPWSVKSVMRHPKSLLSSQVDSAHPASSFLSWPKSPVKQGTCGPWRGLLRTSNTSKVGAHPQWDYGSFPPNLQAGVLDSQFPMSELLLPRRVHDSCPSQISSLLKRPHFTGPFFMLSGSALWHLHTQTFFSLASIWPIIQKSIDCTCWLCLFSIFPTGT